MAEGLRIGAVLPSQGRRPDPGGLLDFARRAEALGFDSLWVPDHVLRVFGPILDPLALLAFVAGGTERIGLGTSVLIAPYRHPVLLANEAASLDALSGGRFVLGVGAGWARDEFDALGLDVGERGRRTDEILEAMQRLWRGVPATYRGRFYAFEGATLGTSPATEGGPRLIVGGKSDAALRRTLRFGADWNGFGDSPEDIRAIKKRLARLGEEVGRDASEVEIGTTLDARTKEPEGAVEEIGNLAEAGVGLCILSLPPEPEGLERIPREIAPLR